MKLYAFLLFSGLLYGGNLFSQSFQWVEDTAKGYEIPLAIGSYEELEKGNFYPEMKDYYDHYSVNTEYLEKLDHLISKLDPNSIRMDVVFGAWCGDSKEHVPHFYKIIARSSYLHQEQVTLMACDRMKKAGDVDISGLNIEFVPTFIFYADDKEIGRIVETPQMSLEEDILRIWESFLR